MLEVPAASKQTQKEAAEEEMLLRKIIEVYCM